MKQIVEVPKLAVRPRDSNKGDFGKILIVGGSRDMVGAPALAANAALRAGAGLVTVAVPGGIQQTVVSLVPCATSLPLAADGDGRVSEGALPELLEAVVAKKRFDVVAIGPGLRRARPLVRFIAEVVKAGIPTVIDADGLNILAETDWHGLLGGPCVMTPHPGELSRLLGTSIRDIQSDRLNHATRAAGLMRAAGGNRGSVCLLKGDKTIVTDGEKYYLNTTGNPGMATGGTGDVLTGTVAAILGQGLSTFDAAVLGAYVHGLAGDLAAGEFGEISLMASDLIDFLPAAFRQLT